MTKPKFRDPKTLTKEQLSDPDYAIKHLEREAKKQGFKMDGCSKCHHCRDW